jgi:xylulokinase
VTEGAAYGAALLAVGGDPRETATRAVQVRGRTNPDAAWAGAYAEAYARFRGLYPALRGV